MVSSSGISFSGLGSGLDTNAIVNQLLALERIPINALESRRSTEQRRLGLVGDLGNLVKSLQSAADDLSTPSEFFAYAATIDQESVATVSASSSAEPGTHTVDVQRLASTDRWAFDAVTDREANLSGQAGEQISFTIGTTDYALTVDENASSLDDLAAGIEEMAGDVVSASIVNTGTESSPSYQLVLSSKESGEEGRITNLFSNVGQTGGAGTSLSINFSAPGVEGEATSSNNITVGNNAIAEINGLVVERSTNSFTDVIEGVTLELRGVSSGGPANVSVEADRTEVRARIDAFVREYNEVIEFINGQNEFTPGDSDDEAGTTGGILFGDSLLTDVKRRIQSALFNVDAATVAADTEGYSTLALIGIEQDSEGRLSVDSAVFDDKFDGNLEALMDLFADTDGFDNGGAAENTPEYYVDTTADSGLMDTLSRTIDQMFGRQPNGDSEIDLQGIFDLREEAIRNSIGRFDDQIERREDRLVKYEETLVLRFARLEELLGGLNAQGQALNSALG